MALVFLAVMLVYQSGIHNVRRHFLYRQYTNLFIFRFNNYKSFLKRRISHKEVIGLQWRIRSEYILKKYIYKRLFLVFWNNFEEITNTSLFLLKQLYYLPSIFITR